MNASFKAIAASGLVAFSIVSHAADVRVERVTFSSGGETLVGNLYLPADAHAGNPAHAAVVAGAWMTIKEQMAGRYARELAERGIAALAFDFRTWGESGGQPRSMENPAAKTADINAAVRYLQTRSDIDKNKVAGLGICASAGYVAQASIENPALRSVALVAPWLHDREIVEQVYGGKGMVETLIATGRNADEMFRKTGKATLLPAASTTDKSAVMFNVPYYTEADRGLVPQWENTFNVSSWERWLTYDAIKNAASFKAPLLVIHSEAAAIPHGAKKFFAAVPSKKQQLWLDNVTQLDFYDRVAPVTHSVEAVVAHFRKSLAEPVARN